MKRPPARPAGGAAESRAGACDGFTIVEVLIALMVLLVGMAGIMSLQMTALKATAFSRHATEATVLAEDRMEALGITPLASLTDDNDRVDARGVAEDEGFYVREWTVDAAGANTVIAVAVSWSEQGGESHSVRMSTVRTP